ncbi:MAG: metal ABC transporter ATP-binding protein [Candidatus Aminicenantes bacterium]|nr:metal ABC transporter ATP-binding protein [Candidatus Aminicenantes bacterium]
MAAGKTEARAAGETLVSVQDVSFAYSEDLVLSGVSLDIQEGDFLAVLGPNGSGKTTLLKLILGLLRPDAGRILLKERPAASVTDRTFLGYVPQKATHFDFFFPASVREVVALGLAPPRPWDAAARKREDAAIRESLALVGMEDCLRRRIGSLSGGQQQRVFLARAIVHKPRILFLDEPTTGVDSETVGHFYDMLGGLNRERTIAIVLVTHDIGIVDRNVNKVACLNRTLVYHGSHKEFCRSQAFRDLLAGGHHLVAHRH